ncbi:MAG: BMC domain-containing protein [Elusimicrobia bacterium]|nr:BMC domain-containing protein [Elusimicrobiota bacterium]
MSPFATRDPGLSPVGQDVGDADRRTLTSIGGVETSSMARGFAVVDAMLKAADVTLLLSRTVCPGKYIALVAGEVAGVNAAVSAGADVAAESLVDQFVIPNIHPEIFPAIAGTTQVTELSALGIVETFSVASLIEAADAAVKAASVRLIEIRLAMALGGKAFVTFTGSVAAVTTSASAAAENAGAKGLLGQKVVIPKPRPELLRELI